MFCVFRALVSSALIASVTGIFLCAMVWVLLLQIHAPFAAFMVGEGLALGVTLIVSVFFFIRALAYERYGDAHRAPLND